MLPNRPLPDRLFLLDWCERPLEHSLLVLLPSHFAEFERLGVPCGDLDAPRTFFVTPDGLAHWSSSCSRFFSDDCVAAPLLASPSEVAPASVCRSCWSRAYDASPLQPLYAAADALRSSVALGGRRVAAPSESRPLVLLQRLRGTERALRALDPAPAPPGLSGDVFEVSGLAALRSSHVARFEAQRSVLLQRLASPAAQGVLLDLVASDLVSSHLVRSSSWEAELSESCGPVGYGHPPRWFFRSMFRVWARHRFAPAPDRAAAMRAHAPRVALGVPAAEPARRDVLRRRRVEVAGVLALRFDEAYAGHLADSAPVPFGLTFRDPRFETFGDDLPDALLRSFGVAGSPGRRIAAAPRPVLLYLASLPQGWSARPAQVHLAPDAAPLDRSLLEVAAALWDPGAPGPFSDLSAALRAASAVTVAL